MLIVAIVWFDPNEWQKQRLAPAHGSRIPS
jgi:hypothetical protein